MMMFTLSFAAMVFASLMLLALPFLLFYSCRKAGFTDMRKSRHLLFWLCFVFACYLLGELAGLLLPAVDDPDEPGAMMMILGSQLTSLPLYFILQALLLSWLFRQDIKTSLRATLRFFLLTFVASIVLLLVSIPIAMVFVSQAS